MLGGCGNQPPETSSQDVDGEWGAQVHVGVVFMVLSLQMERKLVPSDILMCGVGDRTSEYLDVQTVG